MRLKGFDSLSAPPIEPVPAEITRTFWSVMIPTYNPADLLEKTLRSVLDQDLGPDRMEIVIVDDCSPNGHAEEIVQSLASDRVRFISKVLISDDQLVDHLSQAAAMIYTSRLEPFGYAPLEANACGTAVVAVAEGGVRETVRDGVNGVLVSDSDPAALGRAVLGFSSDLDRARAVGVAARRYVEETWSLEKATDRLEGRLLGHCGGGRRADARDHCLEGQPR